MNNKLNEGIMNAVEEQLNSPECPYVTEHFNRLKEMGYSESGAKKLIASVLLNEMKEIAQYKREFDESTYIENLEKLPEKPWCEEDSETIVKKEKIGRNEPCPCGSGKKYKKCCGKNA